MSTSFPALQNRWLLSILPFSGKISSRSDSVEFKLDTYSKVQ